MPLPEATLDQIVSEAQAGVRGYMYRMREQMNIDKVQWDSVFTHILPAISVAADEANKQGIFDKIPSRIKHKRIRTLLLNEGLHLAEKVLNEYECPENLTNKLTDSLQKLAEKTHFTPAAITPRGAGKYKELER